MTPALAGRARRQLPIGKWSDGSYYGITDKGGVRQIIMVGPRGGFLFVSSWFLQGGKMGIAANDTREAWER